MTVLMVTSGAEEQQLSQRSQIEHALASEYPELAIKLPALAINLPASAINIPA